jgi:hypothetical protein
MAVLENDPYTFRKNDEILTALRARYPFKMWERKQLIQLLNMLIQQNKIEKKYIKDLDSGKGEMMYRRKI